MTLHTVNLLPGEAACNDVLAYLDDGDVVLFHGDGAAHARAGAPALKPWLAKGVALYVLAPDLAACGFAACCDPAVTAIDAGGFVDLSERHGQQRAWF